MWMITYMYMCLHVQWVPINTRIPHLLLKSKTTIVYKQVTCDNRISRHCTCLYYAATFHMHTYIVHKHLTIHTEGCRADEGNCGQCGTHNREGDG